MNNLELQRGVIAARKAFEDHADLLQRFVNDAQNWLDLSKAAMLLSACFERGNKVLICGNGGSTCDAMHFAEEFTGRYRDDRPALPVLALSDPGFLTCVANDMGFDRVFERGVEAYGRPGDCFIGLSTSGNSANVDLALDKAKDLGLYTFSILGRTGGRMRGKADMEWIIPGQTADRIQEVHMLMLHTLIELVERNLYPHLYNAIEE